MSYSLHAAAGFPSAPCGCRCCCKVAGLNVDMNIESRHVASHAWKSRRTFLLPHLGLPMQQPPLMTTPPQTKPGPPPTESLAAFHASRDSSQQPSASQQRRLLLGPSAAGTPRGAPADLAVKPPGKPLGGLWGLTGPDSQQPAENAGAIVTAGWGSYTHRGAAASGTSHCYCCCIPTGPRHDLHQCPELYNRGHSVRAAVA